MRPRPPQPPPVNGDDPVGTGSEPGTKRAGVTRRTILGSAAASALFAPAAAAPQPRPSESTPLPPLRYATATALLALLRSRQVSSLELVELQLDRIAEVNPRLNAVVTLAAERALDEARHADAERARGRSLGPLHGLPMTIKDSLDTAGIVSTGGTLGRARFVPAHDAAVVARVRAAGAIVLGKTNTPELTLAYDTDNLVFGATNNPYDPERSPGGSSGGAAAIVAAGGSPCDIGSDTGGSIRWPAHCCGIAGLRPTSGRVPRTGHIIGFGGIADSWTVLGPLARSVDDLTLLLPILAGPDGRDPSIVPAPLGDPATVALDALRVSVLTDNGIVTPEPATLAAVRRAATVLEQAGATVEEGRPPGIEDSHQVNRAIRGSVGGRWIERLLEQAGTERHGFGDLAERSGGTGRDVDEAIERWDVLRLAITVFMDRHDLLLSPVWTGPAPPRPFDQRTVLPAFGYLQTWSLLGWPVAVVRVGTSPEGLPLGVQIVAKPWREDVALAAAKRLETELGGFTPPAI